MNFDFFQVGGCVRDELLGRKSKDIDYSVVSKVPGDAADLFTELSAALEARGFKIFESKPEFFTLRARFPIDDEVLKEFGATRGLTADFVLARRDGPYDDNRRPAWVKAGTLHDDLSRRDFTMNAMAKAPDGEILDPFNGRLSLASGTIECVGDARERIIEEDVLRGLRAIRFAVVLGFTIAPDVQEVLRDVEFREKLATLPIERIYQEMHKAFRHDGLFTIELLQSFGLLASVLTNGMWLEPTLRS